MYYKPKYLSSLKGLYVAFCGQLDVFCFITFLLAVCEQVVILETFHVSLCCPYQPVDDLFKLFHAAGLRISL